MIQLLAKEKVHDGGLRHVERTGEETRLSNDEENIYVGPTRKCAFHETKLTWRPRATLPGSQSKGIGELEQRALSRAVGPKAPGGTDQRAVVLVLAAGTRGFPNTPV